MIYYLVMISEIEIKIAFPRAFFPSFFLFLFLRHH